LLNQCSSQIIIDVGRPQHMSRRSRRDPLRLGRVGFKQFHVSRGPYYPRGVLTLSCITAKPLRCLSIFLQMDQPSPPSRRAVLARVGGAYRLACNLDPNCSSFRSHRVAPGRGTGYTTSCPRDWATEMVASTPAVKRRKSDSIPSENITPLSGIRERSLSCC
jgi:hypothetical protein